MSIKPTITKVICPRCAGERTELTKWVTYTDVKTQDTEFGHEHRCVACGHTWQIIDLVHKFTDQSEANDERKTIQASNQ